MDHKVFLSRRNVQTLLNKLDRVKGGDFSYCAIDKCDNQHPKYAQTMEICRVTAVEDDKLFDHNGEMSASQIFISRTQLGAMLKGDNMMFLIDPDNLVVKLVEDKEYYESRSPGQVYHADDPGVQR